MPFERKNKSICRRCKKPLIVGTNWTYLQKVGRNYCCRKCNTKDKRDFRAKNPEISRQACRKWQRKNRLKVSASHKASILELKAEVLGHYSPSGLAQCSNPFGQHIEPYTDLRALSIDHINGKGIKHRLKIGGGHFFYRWLKNHRFPTGYQTLCLNCQFIKRVEFNELSHGRRKSTNSSTLNPNFYA